MGPIWRGGDHGEEEALASCYRNSLTLAAQHHIKTIAFPAISTGVYGFPADRAATIAVRVVRETTAGLPEIEAVIFVAFRDSAARLLETEIARDAY